jgi:membrane glycosyltransferase
MPAEIILSTMVAPVVLMFGLRAVLRVLLGWDGGWPPSNRADSAVTLAQAWAASWWITCCGAVGIAIVLALAPAVAVWCLPVAIPMVAAPFVIVWTSRPSLGWWLWTVPTETTPTSVIGEYDAILAAWTGLTPGLIERRFAAVPDVIG